MTDNICKLGVISGVGKGIIASSTGLLLKTIGLTVTSIVCVLLFLGFFLFGVFEELWEVVLSIADLE